MIFILVGIEVVEAFHIIVGQTKMKDRVCDRYYITKWRGGIPDDDDRLFHQMSSISQSTSYINSRTQNQR